MKRGVVPIHRRRNVVRFMLCCREQDVAIGDAMTPIVTRILVPVDFSEPSDRAFHYATSLATSLGATVELLHAVDDPFVSGAWNAECVPNVPELLENLMGEARRRLMLMGARAGRYGLDVPAKVVTGQPARAIVEHAIAGLFDLIVIGSHGRSEISHMVMGCVAERVARGAHCPVLTVRETAVTMPTTVG